MASSVWRTLGCISNRQLLNYCSPKGIGNSHLLLSASYAKKVAASGVAAKPVKGAVGVLPQRKQLTPETDPEKLTKFLCGGNIYKEGSDPELKPASEYPEWLWSLRLEREAIPFEEIEPDTWHYWKRLHKMTRKKSLAIIKSKYRYQKF